MEEAQRLSDRIAIMSYGKIKCIGNSLHLTKKFGNGYTVNLQTSPNFVQDVIQEMREVSPKAILKESDAGSLSYQIPKENVEDMPKIVQFLEKNSQVNDVTTSIDLKSHSTKMVKEFGLSHTSLEEVVSHL